MTSETNLLVYAVVTGTLVTIFLVAGIDQFVERRRGGSARLAAVMFGVAALAAAAYLVVAPRIAG